jgi:hypothetical protein
MTRDRGLWRHAGIPGVTALVGVVAMLSAGTALLAHHSATMFEEKKTVTVEGVVKEFQYTNPHSWLLVDVKDKDGKVTTWGFEAEGPSTLQRAGIRPSEFPVGTRVTMTGRPMKDGRPAAIWVVAVRGDGKKFDPREGFRVK